MWNVLYSGAVQNGVPKVSGGGGLYGIAGKTWKELLKA
jgi:hypothetical protein